VVHFVALLCLVSLCADVTYEVARSITGPFLAVLGVSDVVAGPGELLGCLLSGLVSDRTRQYWLLSLTS
jgi:hypothetical protein